MTNKELLRLTRELALRQNLEHLRLALPESGQ